VATHTFDDVSSVKFYHGAVEWAAANSITTGTSTTTFEPDRGVTRGESVTFLKRYDDNIVQPALATLTGDVATNTADIATLTGDVATNTADIATKQDKPTGSSALVIGPAAFNAAGEPDSGVDYEFSDPHRSGGGGASSCIVAPVHLPDGVTVTKLTANLHDSGAGSLNMEFRRDGSGFVAPESIASAGTTDNSGDQSLETTTISNAVIDNSAYSYVLDSCTLDATTLEIHNVVIEYTYPA
jgi:hypothetical protein